VTDEAFAALERRLTAVPAGWSQDRHDVLGLLAECRRLREPPDVSGLMTAAALESLHRYVGSQEGHWLTPAVDHIDAQAAYIRELYGVVADLHADDPGRQVLLERGRAEGREMVLGVLRKFFGAPDPAEYPALAEAFEVAHALGPSRPPLPPHAAEAEAGRLREALSAVVAARDGYDRYEVSLNEVYGAIDAARAALAEEAR
jgi:hypothetical protein